MESSDTPAGVAGRPALRLRLRERLAELQITGLALLPALVVAVIVGSLVSDVFLTRDNIVSILQQSSELAVMVIALSLILIVGKFDLSLESTFGLAPMVGAWLISSETIGGLGLGLSPALALVVVFAIGALVGLFNGFMVVKLKLNAFIVTLAVLILLRGITLGLTSGQTLFDLPEAFLYLGNAEWLALPVSIWVSGALFLAAGAFLRYHRVGRAMYAVGGNAEAARASGIRFDRVVWGAFIVGGLLAALAGLMLTGRIASVTSSQGQNLIFITFAAAVIGGISLNGGRGSMLGAFTGVLLLGTISNILTLSRIESFWIDASFGAIILAALILTRVTTGVSEEEQN
jgi:simple sugar transport system permease protein